MTVPEKYLTYSVPEQTLDSFRAATRQNVGDSTNIQGQKGHNEMNRPIYYPNK